VSDDEDSTDRIYRCHPGGLDYSGDVFMAGGRPVAAGEVPSLFSRVAWANYFCCQPIEPEHGDEMRIMQQVPALQPPYTSLGL
jgi:hypothetical protein